MSTIFIPYVYHNNIDNKFYMVKTTKPLGSPNNTVVTSSVFNTGVKLSRSVDFEDAYLFIIEMLMLYDTCYISLDDLVYLFAVLGKEETELLIRSTAIKVYNSQSTKLGLHKFADKYRVSVESVEITPANIKQRITQMVSSYPKTNIFKEWYIKSILRTLGDTFYINDLKSILDDTAKTSLDELLNSETINIIAQSKDEETSMVDYKQIKLNRLLHFHFYLNLTKHIGCNHIYIPEELNGLYDYYDIENINKNNLEKVFQNVKSLEQIPDIAQLVKIGELSISDIIDIRSTKEAKKFRDWISAIELKAENLTPDEIKAIYHDACMKNTKFSRLYTSKAGNIIKTSISLITGSLPGVSTAISLMDLLISLGLDKFNPSQFTRDQLLELIKKKTK